MGLLARHTLRPAVLAIASLAVGCQAIRLPAPVRPVPGEWSLAQGSPGHNAASDEEIRPPLAARWTYGANAGFGPGGAVTVAGVLIVANRKGELHAIRMDSGRKIGLTDLKTPVDGTPAVSGDRLFVAQAWGTKSVKAFDLVSGSKRWTATAGPVDAGAVVSDGILVVASTNGSVRGFRVEDGSEAWVIEGEFAGQSASFPLSEDGRVFIADETGRVRAIRASDGRVLWTNRTGDAVYVSPTLVGDLLYVSTTRGRVLALDARSGDARWKFDTGNPVVRFTPASVAGDLLFVGSSDGSLRALDPETGESRWTTSLDEGISCQPLVTGSVVWVGTMGRQLVALDAATGDVLWSDRMPGRIKSTMLVHDGGIVVLSEPRNVIYLKPLEGSGDEN